MQSIVTKYLGPTNTRGSRYKAVCEARRLTVSADYGLGCEDNHAAVARALFLSLGWDMGGKFTLAGGALPGNAGHCFVIVPNPSAIPSDETQDSVRAHNSPTV